MSNEKEELIKNVIVGRCFECVEELTTITCDECKAIVDKRFNKVITQAIIRELENFNHNIRCGECGCEVIHEDITHMFTIKDRIDQLKKEIGNEAVR